MGPMRIVPNAREYPGISLYPEQLRVVKTRITWRIARRSPRFFISSYEDFRGGFLQKLNRERESPTSSRGSRFPMMDGNNCSWLLMMKFFFVFLSNDRTKSAPRGSILLRSPMDNTNRRPSPVQKSPRARLHRRNKSHGTYIIRWARGRVTMSSSEKVSEKPRENDKPPAYPVTRRRVTHFFFPSLFFPLPLFILHFAFPSLDGVPIIQLWTHSHRRLRVTLVSTVFHPPPFLHFYSPLRKTRNDRTDYYYDRTLYLGKILCLCPRVKKEKSYDPSPITKLYHRTPPDQTKSARPIFLESNLLRGSSSSSPSSPIEQREESSIRSSSSRFSRTRGPDRGSQLEEVDAKKEEGTG